MFKQKKEKKTVLIVCAFAILLFLCAAAQATHTVSLAAPSGRERYSGAAWLMAPFGLKPVIVTVV